MDHPVGDLRRRAKARAAEQPCDAEVVGPGRPVSSTRPCSAAVSASRRISAVPSPRPCQAFSTSTATGPRRAVRVEVGHATALPPSAVTASTA